MTWQTFVLAILIFDAGFLAGCWWRSRKRVEDTCRTSSSAVKVVESCFYDWGG